MLGIFDTTTVAISVNGADLLALDKLSIVSHALADKIGGTAGREQHILAQCLDELLRQIKTKAALAK